MKDTTTIDEYNRRLDEIRERRRALHEETLGLFEQERKSGYDPTVRESVEARRVSIGAEQQVLDAEYDDLVKKHAEEQEFLRVQYIRPTGRLANLFSRMLGALPERQRVIQPTEEAMQEVRSYRLSAFGLALALVLVVAGLAWLTNGWVFLGPVMLIWSGFYDLLGDVSAAVMSTGVLLAVFVLWAGWKKPKNFPHQGEVMNTMAMSDELWFRSGAESWTRGQRICSVVAFVLTRWYVLITTVPALLVFGVLGVVLMAVYLREYRRTSDTRLATLASAKFHATFYRSVAAIAVIVVVAALISTYIW